MPFLAGEGDKEHFGSSDSQLGTGENRTGIFKTEKGEGSYCTWAVQNVERTFEEISI